MKVKITSLDRIGISQEILAVFAGKSWNVKAIEVERHHTFVNIDNNKVSIELIHESLSHIAGYSHCEAIALMPSQLRENHLYTLLDRLPDPLIDVDANGIILALNNNANKLFSESRDDVIGKKLSQYLDFPLPLPDEQNEYSVNISIHSKLYIADVNPVVVDNSVNGAVIILRSTHQMGRQLSVMQSDVHQGAHSIVGQSSTLKLVIDQTLKFADMNLPVLILGETGTGKELFAKSLHFSSQRRNAPFLSINCASLPEHLLESELFGYESGAFTGANKAGKPGLFELASGGTVFLDEIAEMSVYLQAKLLRFLQDYRFRRIGGTKEIIADVKIVSASHQNFEKLIEQKQFREDLFYRLNVLRLEIPSLRKRAEDIPLLVDHFLKNAAKHVNTSPPMVTPEAMRAMKSYAWPGNIRELENTLFRLVALNGEQKITEKDVKHVMRAKPNNTNQFSHAEESDVKDWHSAQQAFEKQLLTRLYPHYPTTRKLAERLNVSHNKIAMKLREYGIRR
ncbi:sigma 54-interacting transcriptional regulator [Thalassotalea ganghwensis]